jgi:hypothetical protein
MATTFRKFNEVDYDKLKQAARHYAGETGYCSVIALAIASGCKFGKARAIMARQGRANGRGVYLPQIEDALKEAGMQVRSKFSVRGQLKKVNTRLPSTGTFYVFTHGHITCVKDGVIEDWSAPERMASCKLVTEVWEIEYNH